MTSAPALDLVQLKKTCSDCALQDLCLPSAIRGDDLRDLDRIVTNRLVFDAGRALFNAGTPFTSLYVVRKGSFKTWQSDENGNLQILGFHLPGEILGFDALMDEVHRCTAEALETSRACRIPYDQLQSICVRVPELQKQLMKVISREVSNDHEHLVMMGRRQAMERLAIFLQSLSHRRQRLGQDPTHLTLSMSRADLANYLGLVVETVSRLFTRMQEMGVLEVQRKEVTILDPDRLCDLMDG